MQIVLHNSDGDEQEDKDNVRNLGLKSIVEREDMEVASLIGQADNQNLTARNVTGIAKRLETVMKNLQFAAAQIGVIIQQKYAADDKTSKYITLTQGVYEILGGDS